MLPSWCTDTVQVVRPAAKASRGTTVPDWANAQRHTVSGCRVTDASTGEDRDGRTATRIIARLWAPPGADVRAGDAIEFDGARYLVEGEPMPRRSPTGQVSHLRCDLAAWRG